MNAKKNPDVPAKANDFISFFSEEIFLREVKERDLSLVHFQASMKNA
jgi:hypothetical protein